MVCLINNGGETMKKCEQCKGIKRYMKTSSVDSMFSELTYCRKCDENGDVVLVDNTIVNRVGF